jgi:NDP-sugar pyrophosphorylase family protein
MIQEEHMVKSPKNTNKLTVLILAAGYGRRMGPFSRMVNKSLVPYNNKPLISHIMEKFPTDTSFVIVCGNLGQQVKEYVSIVHEEKTVTYVDIPEFDDATTGPATTIRYCAEYLPGAFMWITCDTLFDFDYSNRLDENWIAVHPVDSNVSQDYCWVERNGNDITGVRNKVKSTHAVDAFIGLMYAKDSTFIENLNTENAKDVYKGFDNLNLKAYTVRMWQDFGTYEKWKQLSEGLPEVSFPKPDELFYADNGKIIKYTSNAKLATLRHQRALLNPLAMPDNVSHSGHFLFYDSAPGETLYTCLTLEIFKKCLEWGESTLWKQAETFGDTFSYAETFYHTKTLDRLEKFRTKYSTWVECPVVNGCDVKTIEEYLEDIDFAWLASETRWCFTHGDMQFDNIIYDATSDKFTAIDWRTDFAGDLYGDMYYDLAKMLGGLYLSYKSVKENKLTYVEEDASVTIDIPSVESVLLYTEDLKSWALDRGMDWDKVRTLVPIIYLNMAPLHEAPFDKYLISLAQLHFSYL